LRQFFSILLPTKNRSKIVDLALKSVVYQNFTDYEFILVDNSDDDETKKTFDKYRSANRNLTYVKTGGLLMADNWQKAIEAAHGEYYIVMEDKQALRCNALEELFNLIETYKFLCIAAYPDLFIDTTEKPHVIKCPQGNAIKVHSSEDIINSFLTKASSTSQVQFPSGHHSVVSKKIVSLANSSILGRYCHPIAPDITSGLFQLFFSDTIARLPEAHTLITTSTVSNGILGLKTKDVSEVVERDRIERTFKYVPIKAAFLVNGIFNDYMFMRSKLGGKFTNHQLNLPEYFTQCYLNIQKTKEFGTDVSKEEREWKARFNQLSHVDISATFELIETRTSSGRADGKSLATFAKAVSQKIREGLKHTIAGGSIDKSASERDDDRYNSPMEYLEKNPMNLGRYRIEA
jgi:glycosyltransferase involved in cell wall biosynthesis